MTIATQLEGHVEKAARSLLGMRLRTEFGGRITEVFAHRSGSLWRLRRCGQSCLPGSERAERARCSDRPERSTSTGPTECTGAPTWWPERKVPAGRSSCAGREPLEGKGVMQQRRGRTDQLTDGPGKLAQALGIDGSHDGLSLIDGPIRLLPRMADVPSIVATPRVGISKAKERLWRFVLVR